jgi:hypothetical protein
MKDLYRQIKLETRYEEGDTKVDLCSCGTYFINQKWNNGAYDGKFLIFNKCQECRREDKKRKK